MSNKLDRSNLRNRARRALFWCALVLLISPVPGGWLVDHCPIQIRFPEAAATISSWEKANPQPDILLLGSSRLGSFVRSVDLSATTKGLVGNDPPLVFNSTIPGGDPITLEFLTRRLLASRSTAPRLVVLETNADLLARDNVYFTGVITQLMTATDIPKYLRDILLYHDGISRLLSSRLTPFFRHRSHFLAWASEAIIKRFSQNQGPIDNNERLLNRWRDLANNPTDGFAEAERLRIALRRFQNHLRHYQLAGATPSAFEETVAMLHKRGCAVVLVQPPLSSAHRAFLSASIRSQFAAFLQRLHDPYGCEFFDYSDKLPDTFFSDNHHANAAGSSRFTELLAHEVVAPAWRKLQVKQEDNRTTLH
jgi:hypothetical protein